MATITCPRCKTKYPDNQTNCEKCKLNLRLINRLMFRLIQVVGLMFILALSFGGIAIMNVQPLPILTCRHVNREQVDCQIQERIAWVMPIRESSLTDLKEAYVNREIHYGEDENGDEYTFYSFEVVLVSATDEFVLKGSDEHGFISNLTARRINNFLNTPTRKPLTIWAYGLATNILVTVIGGFIFLLFGFSFVVAIVDMVFGPGAVGKILKIRRTEDQGD